MSSSPVAALIVALTLSAVLAVSGAAKLRDRRATQDAFVALRVPQLVPAGPSAAALPRVEIALAVLLLVSPEGWAVAAAAAVLVLMLAYTVLIGRALRFDEPVTCSCFGSIGRHDVALPTLGRNVLLALLAGAFLVFVLDGGSAPSAFALLAADEWWALLAAAAAAAVAVLIVAQPTRDGRPSSADVVEVDYERRPIPWGVVNLMDGRTATLAELASEQARLVVLLNAGCSPCVRTAEKLEDWSARLAPAVGVLAVYPNEESARDSPVRDDDLKSWEPERNVRRIFSAGAPTAVLLGADGALAGGPVSGEDEVAELVSDVIAEITGVDA